MWTAVNVRSGEWCSGSGEDGNGRANVPYYKLYPALEVNSDLQQGGPCLTQQSNTSGLERVKTSAPPPIREYSTLPQS